MHPLNFSWHGKNGSEHDVKPTGMLNPSREQNLLKYFAPTCSGCVVLWQVSSILAQNSRNISNLSLLKIFEEPVWKHVAFPSLHSLHFFAGWINCRAQASWERTNSRWVQERSIEFASNHWTPYSDQDQRFNRRLETKKQEQKLGKDLYLLDDPEINALGKSRIHRDTGYFRNTWRFRHEDGCCTRNCLKFLVITYSNILLITYYNVWWSSSVQSNRPSSLSAATLPIDARCMHANFVFRAGQTHCLCAVQNRRTKMSQNEWTWSTRLWTKPRTNWHS